VKLHSNQAKQSLLEPLKP